ncbi:tubulin epsilon [Strigomonas culicis]|uniref:Tubulin epsilon n=1 Tax=Strigomonas culicis TaxID=28005 RepID=S9UXY8_9TRYP|nr:tubulin epsilon [Strigomonas culicis]EPY34533.1 tubulin epsilon [Strigomonas culicis]|eukprot:EPY33703.1 tubulin epsilon [Strigomonas culicis]
MPREIITVQVGQCGNQLGLSWWDLMLQEHLANSAYTEARDALFLTSPAYQAATASSPRSKPGAAPPAAAAKDGIKARCVAVDLEEGVLASLQRSKIGHLFDSNFFINDVSGAGNNWGVGHIEYGDKYIQPIQDTVRRQVEACDCIQSFFIMHSLSGGTGSGLGTRVVGMLEEEFPHILRISPVVMPSIVDDVVTAPYNSCFAMKELIEHSDCVVPLDNDALARMADRALKGGSPPGRDVFSAASPTQTKGLPYSSMNALVAQMLSNLTSAMRFPGPLNFDINEITTNLVPFPRLHFLTTALAPLRVSERHALVGPRTVDAMMAACLERDHQLVDFNTNVASLPGGGGGGTGSSPYYSLNSANAAGGGAVSGFSDTCLATALIARGPQITIGDVNRNIQQLNKKLKLPYWNEDGFKTALCGVSPLGHKDSVLMISNSCGITRKINFIYEKFAKLYAVRSHVHHYEAYLSRAYFDTTLEDIKTVLDDYSYLNTNSAVPQDAPKSMKDLVYY